MSWKHFKKKARSVAENANLISDENMKCKFHQDVYKTLLKPNFQDELRMYQEQVH